MAAKKAAPKKSAASLRTRIDDFKRESQALIGEVKELPNAERWMRLAQVDLNSGTYALARALDNDDTES